GIRDYKVTGVQTCALPIFVDHLLLLPRPLRGRLAGDDRRALRLPRKTRLPARRRRPRRDLRARRQFACRETAARSGRHFVRRHRSEERRVGKEWRAMWTAW